MTGLLERIGVDLSIFQAGWVEDELAG